MRAIWQEGGDRAFSQIEPLAYLTDVLTRLPTHPNSRIEELLPMHWRGGLDGTQ